MSDSEGEPSAGGNRGEGPPRRRRRLNVLPGSPGSESDEGRDSGAREAVDEEREAREAEEARRDLLAAQGIDGGIDSGDERPISEPDEGEDLMENMEADYAAIDVLDRYDDAVLDAREYDAMDPRTRAEVEAELRERDQRDGRRGAFDYNVAEEFGAEEDAEQRAARRGRFDRRRTGVDGGDDGGGDGSGDGGGDGDDDDFGEDDEEIDLEQYNVPLAEWLSQDRTRQEIRRRFRRFLQSYKPEDAPQSAQPVHIDRIHTMCSANKASLDVSYRDICLALPQFGIWLVEAPQDMIALMSEVANREVLRLFPEYGRIQDEIHVRIFGVAALEKIRDLRELHLGQLVRVAGVITRRSGVFPQLRLVKYTCTLCGMDIGPFDASMGDGDARPASCPNCNNGGPFQLNHAQTVYRNYQKITLQESPGSVQAGRVPRHKEVILLSDLIDCARPGEEVEVTGVYVHNFDTSFSRRSGFPVFNTRIEANHVLRKEERLSMYSLTDEDKRELHQLAKDPRIAQRIIQSIAPSIYGHTHVKHAIAMALFGGCPKDVNGKHRIRGDINCLLLGDPGTAKSQVLKYCEQTAPRAVYTTGKGASAVGLTAGVHKDPLTKEWTLEGGALVLADKGVCLIDEFDKMTEQDRTSIHEAMEQQSISVSKAGIVTSLQARCAVIAAANPIGGRYDASLTLAENVELTDPILQRFDCLCVLQDQVDPVIDEQLARFVVRSHRKSHPAGHGRADVEEEDELQPALSHLGEEQPLSQETLRKYITYARNHVRPQLRSIDSDKVAKLYADLRRESMSSGGVPVAVRHIESVIRMAEATARMHLRDTVRDDDVDAAISVLLTSFIQAQKFSVRRSLEKGFRKYLSAGGDFNELLMRELLKLVKMERTYLQHRNRLEENVEVRVDDLQAKAHEFNVYDLTPFYASKIFAGGKFTLDRERGVILAPV